MVLLAVACTVAVGTAVPRGRRRGFGDGDRVKAAEVQRGSIGWACYGRRMALSTEPCEGGRRGTQLSASDEGWGGERRRGDGGERLRCELWRVERDQVDEPREREREDRHRMNPGPWKCLQVAARKSPIWDEVGVSGAIRCRLGVGKRERPGEQRRRSVWRSSAEVLGRERGSRVGAAGRRAMWSGGRAGSPRPKAPCGGG
jgi:hypothetical protein